jgi:hypothetical protein
MNVNISNRQVAKAYDICAQLLVLPRREHTREIIEASKNIFIQLYPTIRESTLVGLDAEYIAPTLFEYNSKCNLDDELIQQITALSFENPLQWNANINEDQEINDHELMLEAAKRLANSALTQISAKNPTDKDLTFWATYLKTIPLESTLWLTGLKTMEALDRPEYIRALSTLVEDCCKGAPALLQLLGLWADYQYNFFFPAEDFYEDLREILLELNLDKRNDISRKIAELSDEQLHIMGQTASVSLDMQQLDRLKQDVLDFFAADPPED